MTLETPQPFESTSPRAFEAPPHLTNDHGDERRCGVELEVAGLDLEDAAATVRAIFNGQLEKRGPFELRVTESDVGDFSIVVDATLLRERKYLKLLGGPGGPSDLVDLKDLEKPLEKLVGWLAELVVPFEIATPPIAFSEMPRLEELRSALAERGARGTGASLRYAFGLHINPEVPSLEASSILRHLRAFLVLYPQLLEETKVDLTRRLTPYIDAFEAPYLRLVLDPEYRPALDQLAADYVAHNPTRNRPLDLLPLFVYLLGPKVAAGVPSDEPISPRPTFHYRLPNCRIDEPEWTLAEEWNRWVEVERLADQPEELMRRCDEARPDPGLWGMVQRHAMEAWRGEGT